MVTNKNTGDIGEHWVLYRLVRAGYTATLAPVNAKAVDILVADRNGKLEEVFSEVRMQDPEWNLLQGLRRTSSQPCGA